MLSKFRFAFVSTHNQYTFSVVVAFLSFILHSTGIGGVRKVIRTVLDSLETRESIEVRYVTLGHGDSLFWGHDIYVICLGEGGNPCRNFAHDCTLIIYLFYVACSILSFLLRVKGV